MEYITNVGWLTIYEDGVFHVIPYHDIKSHLDSIGCPCKPSHGFNVNGTPRLYHNSFDGREFFEDAGDFGGYKTISLRTH